MTSTSIPPSAKDQLLAVKTVHQGKHGATVFALRSSTSSQPQRALRIVAKDQSKFLTKAFIDKLKAIQDQGNHPLARIHEHDTDISWYTMNWVQGCTVGYLLGNCYTNGLPPFLLCRVLDQVARAEKFLQEHGLCHVDLSGGENILLRDGGWVVPSIKLLDFSGVKPYISNEVGHVLTEFMALAKHMTQGQERVPDFFVRKRGGAAFGRDSLVEMDWLYRYVAHWRWDGKQTLEKFWDHNEDQVGLRVMANVDEMRDNGMLEELWGWVRKPVVSEEEIAAAKESGGLDVV